MLAKARIAIGEVHYHHAATTHPCRTLHCMVCKNSSSIGPGENLAYNALKFFSFASAIIDWTFLTSPAAALPSVDKTVFRYLVALSTCCDGYNTRQTLHLFIHFCNVRHHIGERQKHPLWNHELSHHFMRCSFKLGKFMNEFKQSRAIFFHCFPDNHVFHVCYGSHLQMADDYKIGFKIESIVGNRVDIKYTMINRIEDARFQHQVQWQRSFR